MSEKTLFCGKCGAPLPTNAKFCEQCGAAVPDYLWDMIQSDEEETEPYKQEDTATEEPGTESEKRDTPEQSRTKRGASLKYLILAIAVAVVALIVILLLLVPNRIRLDQYMTVECMGYDGYGSVTCTFDADTFYRDYGDKIRFSGGTSGRNSGLAGGSDYAVGLFYETCVDWDVVLSDSTAENGHLSNGDEAVIEWRCDEQAARKNFKVRLRCSDITYTLAGLPEAEEVDFFEYVDVIYEGTDTYGTASVDLREEALQMGLSEENFNLSKEGNLNNGDRVTVRINGDTLDSLVQERGITPKEMEKEYIVEGLESSDLSAGDFSDELSSDAEYLCSFSSERLITDADMVAIEASNYGPLPADRSLPQMLINEIYARHGYHFETEEIQEYFEAKEWYRDIGSYESDMDVVSDSLTKIEKENVTYLKSL